MSTGGKYRWRRVDDARILVIVSRDFCFCFFFFKQKTAYEISLGLVGSEMCIRDRTTRVSNRGYENAGGVRVVEIVEDPSDLPITYDPSHP